METKKNISFKQHTGLLSPWVDGMRVNKVVSYIFPRSRVLDIGCGPGFLIPQLPSDTIYVGVDRDPDLILSNRENYPLQTFYCFDVCSGSWPFQPAEFDRIILAAFLEHIERSENLFSEMARVLKQEGRIIITTPSRMGGWLHHVLSQIDLLSHDAAQEHKDFWEKELMKSRIINTPLVLESFAPFQLGLNQLFILKKS